MKDQVNLASSLTTLRKGWTNPLFSEVKSKELELHLRQVLEHGSHTYDGTRTFTERNLEELV